MTIDAGWTRVLKTECPNAFTFDIPRVPAVVAIDMQTKLQPPTGITSWRQFMDVMVFNTIDRAFATGASVVVAAWDNYEFVPAAKNMTQRKRTQRVPTYDFDPNNPLPHKLPENWAGAIRNRNFKVKVIQLIIVNIADRYGADTHRSVAIDFVGPVQVVGKPIDLPALLSRTEPVPKRGECDIKLFTWMPPPGAGPLLIVSIDADFLPLSLLHLHSCPEADIMLYRMTTTVAKRKRETFSKYEFVSMPEIARFVSAQCPSIPSFCAMVAAIGCDFTENLPRIGPERLWKMRGLFSRMDLTSEAGLMLMLCKAYHETFRKSCRVPPRALATHSASTEEALDLYHQTVAAVVSNSRVSLKTRDALLSPLRAQSHCRNTLWTLAYWTLLHDYPDPIDPHFGFCYDEKGRCQFA